MDAETDRSSAAGPSPFSSPAFAVLWTATVLSNIGTWMHDVGASWLMTSLSPAPLMVALVQGATALPVFLFSLPAGALADILDRRRLLLAVQIFMGLVAACLGCIVLLDLVNAWSLLFFTLLMGTGAALTAPAWQAIVPSLAPPGSLQRAIAANSVGVNISRAIGPALAGLLITALGITVPFFANAVSFLAVVAALLWWRPQAGKEPSLPPEHLLGAMLAGLRYARHSAPLKTTLIRAVAFFLFANAFWSLLPLVVRRVLGGGVGLYGIVLGCVGTGAVLGAFALPWLRARMDADRLVHLGTCGTALAMLVLAMVNNPAAACLASLVAGTSWIAILTSLGVSAQTALPDWVRARGLSIFVTVFFGSMTAGSLVWGQTAGMFGIQAALITAALLALLFIPLSARWKLQQGLALQLAPSMHWPEPLVDGEIDQDRGPVLVTVEYRVDPENVADFLNAMRELHAERRHDGAYSWGLFEDAAQPGRYIEYFLVSSWLEHLRQHERVTVSGREVQLRIQALQSGGRMPLVSHLLAAGGRRMPPLSARPDASGGEP